VSGLQGNAQFYVVGGPVQPDRDCYVVRDADAALYTRLSAGEYCDVLAPPDSGSTSLIAHTANRLRADGVAVANVDLAQISNRSITEDIGRWYYSVAYRILRELRVRFGLQDWWQERSGLTNLQRLREFFREVLLTATDARVVVFVDRIETALGHPEALDLFGAIRACYDARATEPEFRRLSFALLGSAPPGKLIPSGQASPFDVSVSIPLADFDLEEVGRLTAGLPCDAGTARAIAERAWHWTAGHPYLTQKLLRAIARRPGADLSAETVDQWVANLFLTRNATREEPHLSRLRSLLLRDSRDKVARLSLYGKVRKGATVASEHVLATHRDLLRVGLLLEDSDGNLALRNRVYAEVFTAHWVNRNLPFSLRGLAAVAAVLLVALAIPVWYSEYLPEPYIRVLRQPDADFVNAQAAYQRLSFLPGFGVMADELFAEYLARQSRRASRLIEVQRFGELLMELPEQEQAAARLEAEFWDRSRLDALRAARRDDALLFALRAVQQPTDARERAVAELLLPDYTSLVGTIRPQSPLTGLAMDSSSGLVSLLDTQHRLGTWQVTDSGPRQIRALQLLAEEVIPLPSRAVVEGQGNGRRLRLSVLTDHPRPRDIQVELRAPSGRSVRVMLADSGRTDDGVYQLDSREQKALRPLLDESVDGTWTAYFTDIVQGIGGSLQAWSLDIDGQTAQVAAALPGEATDIPEPVATRQLESLLDATGRQALTWPSSAEVRGDVLVWNLGRGEVVARLPRPVDFARARFALGQRAALLTIGRNLQLWDLERAELRLSIPFEPSLEPVLSSDGRFLVVDSVLADDNNVLAVWDLETGREVRQLVTGDLAALAQVNESGELLAVSDGESLVRLWNMADGSLSAELPHAAAPIAIHFHPAGRWLATEDAGHRLHVWSLDDPSRPALTRQAASQWAVRFDRQNLLIGNLSGGYELIGLSDLARRGPLLRHGTNVPRRSRGSAAGSLLLSSDLGLALSWDGEQALRLWRLPPGAQDALAVGRPVAGAVAAIGPGGRHLAVARATGDVTILPSRQETLLLPGGLQGPGFIGHLEPVTALAFSPDGRLLASGATDGSLRVWDVATGAPRRFMAGQGDNAVLEIAFSPDGRFVMSASRSSVIVIDTTSGELLARTAIQSSRPQLSVSDDGTEVIIVGDRDGISRWVWQAGILSALLPPDEKISAGAIERGSERFVTVDSLRRVYLWTDAQTRQPVRARLPALPERLWFGDEGRSVYAQAGVWLMRLQLSADGLRMADTRLLAEPPMDLALGAEAGELLALGGLNGARLKLERLRMDEAPPLPEENRAPPDSQRIEEAVGLSLSDWGEPQAMLPF